MIEHDPLGPGHTWVPVSESDLLHELLPSERDPQAVDLHKRYPLPNGIELTSIWDGRVVSHTDTPEGVRIGWTILNPSAEGGNINWFPGAWVTSRSGGGARVALTLAALNQDKRVIAYEEPDTVPYEHREAANAGRVAPYASNYLYPIHEINGFEHGVNVLAGQSRGSRIAAALSAHPDLPPQDAISLAEVPGVHPFRTAHEFAIRTGVFENLPWVRNSTRRDVDFDEEALLHAVIEGGSHERGAVESVWGAVSNMWYVRMIGDAGVRGTLEDTIDQNPDALLAYWHGRANLGIPLDTTRHMIREIMARTSNVVYLESNTRHSGNHHTPRYSRQVTHTIHMHDERTLETT